jgi:hypothetical protein
VSGGRLLLFLSLGAFSYVPKAKDSTTNTTATRLLAPRILALSAPLDMVLMGVGRPVCYDVQRS